MLYHVRILEEALRLLGNIQVWDSSIYENNGNQDVSELTSHDALGKELQLIIKNLEPGTKEIKKTNAMQKVNIYVQ